MSDLEIGMWILFVGCSTFFAFMYFVMIRSRQQQQDLESDLFEGLEKLGLKVHPEIDPKMTEWLEAALTPQRLQSQKKRYLGTGNYRGSNLLSLQLESVVHTGQSVITIRQTVCIIPLEKQLPKMEIAPKNILHNFFRFLMPKSVRFYSHPQFEKKYYVKGEDFVAIEEALPPRALEFLENNTGIFWAITGQHLIYFQPTKAWYSYEDQKIFLDRGVDLKDLLLETT